jgi:hypothetical protein
MTLVRLVKNTKIWLNKHINFVIMGGSAKGEERIFCNTNYFEELTNFYPECTFMLYFAGPELSETRHQQTVKLNDRLNAFFYKGTTSEFLLNSFSNISDIQDKLLLDQTIFVGFNPGFGSGYAKLVHSWALDIVFLLGLKYRIVFTQANDYSDLRGESRIFEKLFDKKVNYFI